MNTPVPSYADDIYNPVTSIEDLYQGEIHDEEYDLLVFIGRFRPFHLGHRRVVDIALRKAKKVLILVGSAYQPRRPRNPWTWEEVAQMVRASFPNVPKSKLLIRPMEDYTYRDEMWVASVQEEVKDAISANFPGRQKRKIGLIGCSKDSSSYYLKLFPQWGNVNVRFLNPLNATDIRNRYFENVQPEMWWAAQGKGQMVLDPGVVEWLQNFREHPEYDNIRSYHDAAVKYKRKRQGGAEYFVYDLAADAVVTQSGHILLIERKSAFGNGLLALPGGHKNPDETFLDCAIRELREETRLRVPVPVLKGSIKDLFVADDPYRSERGGIVSQAFHFKLADQTELPEVRGDDDAKRAFWLPLSELQSNNMFEDHYHIICKLLRI